MWPPAPAPGMFTALASRVDVSRTSGVLLAGDLSAIALFVLAGELRHDRPLAAGAGTFAEFAAGWLLAAIVVGAYAADAIAPPRRGALIAAVGWLLGATLGQLIRLAAGHRFFWSFFLVTLGVGGALLVGWRLAAGALLGER